MVGSIGSSFVRNAVCKTGRVTEMMKHRFIGCIYLATGDMNSRPRDDSRLKCKALSRGEPRDGGYLNTMLKGGEAGGM